MWVLYLGICLPARRALIFTRVQLAAPAILQTTTSNLRGRTSQSISLPSRFHLRHFGSAANYSHSVCIGRDLLPRQATNSQRTIAMDSGVVGDVLLPRYLLRLTKHNSRVSAPQASCARIQMLQPVELIFRWGACSVYHFVCRICRISGTNPVIFGNPWW